MQSAGEKVNAFFRYLELDNAGALRNHMERSKKDVEAVLVARPMKMDGPHDFRQHNKLSGATGGGRAATSLRPKAPKAEEAAEWAAATATAASAAPATPGRGVRFGKNSIGEGGTAGGASPEYEARAERLGTADTGHDTARSAMSSAGGSTKGLGSVLAGRFDKAAHEGLLHQGAQMGGGLPLESEDESSLRLIFYSYCTQHDRFGAQMGPSGFHKLVKEAQLLDNKFSFADADVLLSQADFQGGAMGAAEVTGQVKGDNKVALEEFKALLHSLADRKFPKAANHEERYGRLLNDHILPNASRVARPSPVDELYEDGVIDLFQRYNRTLWSVFLHYATLDQVSVDPSNWGAVRHANRTINLDEYMMFMLNFEVTPQLLGKREVQAIFRAANLGESADANVDDLCFPEFLECLGRCALVVAMRLDEKLESQVLTVHERSAVLRVCQHSSPAAAAHYQGIMDRRRLGRAGTLKGGAGHFSNLDDAILLAQRDKEAAVERDTKVAQLMGLSYSDVKKPEAPRQSSIFVTMGTLSGFIQEDFEDPARMEGGGARAKATKAMMAEIARLENQQMRERKAAKNAKLGLASKGVLQGLTAEAMPSVLLAERPCSRGLYVL